ncbi:C2H2-type domain-containing protein [Mycena kentingensis (nom. inval.)]|nr:C2H2-type domain-containing protein [Mycena kentingensis (nom. inval.)]
MSAPTRVPGRQPDGTWWCECVTKCAPDGKTVDRTTYGRHQRKEAEALEALAAQANPPPPGPASAADKVEVDQQEDRDQENASNERHSDLLDTDAQQHPDSDGPDYSNPRSDSFESAVDGAASRAQVDNNNRARAADDDNSDRAPSPAESDAQSTRSGSTGIEFIFGQARYSSRPPTPDNEDDSRPSSPAEDPPPLGHNPNLPDEFNWVNEFIAFLRDASFDNEDEIEPDIAYAHRNPPTEPIDLTPDERLSIRLYLATINASEWSYKEAADAVMERSDDIKVLSYHNFPTIPIGLLIQAIWRSTEGRTDIEYREKFTEQLLRELEESNGIRTSAYKDFFDGSDYLGRAGLSMDEEEVEARIRAGDMVLMFSMDGAQLYRNKVSEVWILLGIIPSLVAKKGPPHGAISVGDQGHAMLRRADNIFRRVNEPEEEAIEAYIRALYGEDAERALDEWDGKVRRYSRASLPNGQIARCTWSEHRNNFTRTNSMVKVATEVDDDGNILKVEIAEVRFFAQLEVLEDIYNIAVGSFFGPPDEYLLSVSHGTYWSAQHSGDGDVRLFLIPSIQSVVAMLPDHQYQHRADDESADDRFFLVEKPGLGLASHEDDEEEDDEDEDD